MSTNGQITISGGSPPLWFWRNSVAGELSLTWTQVFLPKEGHIVTVFNNDTTYDLFVGGEDLIGTPQGYTETGAVTETRCVKVPPRSWRVFVYGPPKWYVQMWYWLKELGNKLGLNDCSQARSIAIFGHLADHSCDIVVERWGAG